MRAPFARGKWIARQDGDDWSEPDRLERQMTFLAAHPGVVLCGTAAWRHREDGSRLWRARVAESHAAILAALERGNPFFHGSVVFLKSAAERMGGYREQFPCSQDYDLFWRLAEAGEAANLGEALYHYRYCAGSVSASRSQEHTRTGVARRRCRHLDDARLRGGSDRCVVRCFRRGCYASEGIVDR